MDAEKTRANWLIPLFSPALRLSVALHTYFHVMTVTFFVQPDNAFMFRLI